MKLTPLLLFLLLLVVLVIAVTTLRNPIAPVEKEGFVQFKTNVVPQTEVVVSPYSSRSIVKLYDNLFIDRQNINLVEVVSSEFIGNIDSKYVVTKGNVDATGASITAINVQTRDGAIKNYPVTSIAVKETDESKISSITSSYKSVPFYTSACNTTAKYQLFYIPWGTDTYIHGIETTPTPSTPASAAYMGNHIFTYRIPSDKTANLNAKLYTTTPIDIMIGDSNVSNTNPAPTTTTTDNDNNKMVAEPLYHATTKLYQLTPDIKYDVKNGNIIVNSNKAIIIYDRSGQPTTFTSVPPTMPSILPNVPFNPWIIKNVSTKTQILYVQSGNNTLVVLFKRDQANRLSIVNMARFNENGIDDGTTTPDKPTPGPPPPGPDVNQSAISDYYKWYWYWNSMGPETNPQYSNNYLLKTQIVPPVCPSCPTATCASTASAVDSGKDGSVKKDSNGNIITDAVDTTGNIVTKTVDTTSNVLNKTIDTTSNLLTAGATGATNLLTAGATGASNLLTSGVSGATNLVKSGVTGTVDLAKDAGSGVITVADKTLSTAGNIVGDLTGGAGAGAVGGSGAYYGGLNTPYGSGSGYSAPGFSRGSPPVDNYSYYGALPNKGSNYIPITADFSAFKK